MLGMNRFSILVAIAFISTLASVAQARVEALFHPTDPTLEKVGEWIQQAHKTIDIAMYNMDTSAASPVVQALMDPRMSARLKTGDVTIRLIFEGYGKPSENEKKMQELEALGIDVRFLKSGKKVHHKFAVIDSGTAEARVITGSANWSLTSYRNYDENMLFFENEREANFLFESEFQSLWDQCAEFGETIAHAERPLPELDATDRLDVFFNSARLLAKDPASEHVLTNQVVRLIDGARTELEIATTRVRLVPILESLKAAASRGVKIKLLISQDDYHDLWKRSDSLLAQPNLELRIKFYNLKPAQYITKQMHNKFMIVDHETIETGSFNWSDSSENAHIENVVELKGDGAKDVMAAYQSQFDQIWDRGRDALADFMASLSEKKQKGELPACAFAPMSLSYDEVRALLKLAPKCGADSSL